MTDWITDDLVEEMARTGHEAYERAAKAYGWDTQAASQTAWADVPEENRLTMLAAYRAALTHVAPRIEAAIADEDEEDTDEWLCDGCGKLNPSDLIVCDYCLSERP